MKNDRAILDEPVEKSRMGAAKLQPRYTVDEYLALERAAEERHIYLDGEIIAMAGESLPHGYITVNVVASLATQLKGTRCSTLTKDMRIRSGPIPMPGHSKKGLFSYPDIVVVCGDPEFHDSITDIILNPKVIVEVLSKSAEDFDRGEKFSRLKKHNPTLTDYLLISQDKPQIEHFRRKADGKWPSRIHDEMDGTVTIASIRCTLKLADVYDRVRFPKGPA